MKKNKFQEQFLLELAKVPIIQVACEKTGLSRNSVYRWKKEDKAFSKKMDTAFAEGVALVNDMSESQLLTLIKEKSFPALSFWLRHRNDNYKNKLEITTKEESEALTPSQAKIVRNALKLASITKSKSIKRINKTKQI
jgi:predicted DNA-binding transcriptional regulator AlpA